MAVEGSGGVGTEEDVHSPSWRYVGADAGAGAEGCALVAAAEAEPPPPPPPVGREGERGSREEVGIEADKGPS